MENEDVGVKQFVIIEVDIFDFTPDEDVNKLTLNDFVNKSTASFYSSKIKDRRSCLRRLRRRILSWNSVLVVGRPSLP